MTLQMIPMASSFVIPQIRQRRQQYGQVKIQRRRRHDSFLQDSHCVNMESSSIVIINNNNDDNDSHVNITIQVPQYYYDSNTNHNNNNNKKKSHNYPSLLHNIHVEPLLSLAEAATCLELAKRYGQDTGKWKTPDYQRHTNYATCDFSVLMDVHEDHDDDENDHDTHTNGAPELHSYLMNDLDFQPRIFTRLSQAYNVDYDDLLGFIDLFCVNYVAKNGNGNGDDFEEDDDDNDNPNNINSNNNNDQTMDRLEAHRDGSILSFTVLLTPPDEFEGGGTFFDALRLNGGSPMENDGKESQRHSSSSTISSINNNINYIVQHDNGIVRPPAAGYTVMHCGKLLHGADRVTHGHRTVLVGFVDVADWAICDGVERRACTTFGRMDVAERRAQLQLQQLLKLSTLTQEETSGSNSHHDINNNDNGRSRLHRGWSARRSTRFLPKTSCFNRIIPAFDTALQRADPEFQRKTRLQAEDLLLRTILVEEKSEFLQRILSSGDVSVL